MYSEIIGICKLASDFYKKDPVKKEMFTFARILHNMGEARQAKTDGPVTEKTAK